MLNIWIMLEEKFTKAICYLQKFSRKVGQIWIMEVGIVLKLTHNPLDDLVRRILVPPMKTNLASFFDEIFGHQNWFIIVSTSGIKEIEIYLR